MRADVRHAVQAIVCVAREEQGFREDAWQEGHRPHLPGHLQLVGIAHQLPAAREDPFCLQAKDTRVGIDTRRQGVRVANVVGDGEHRQIERVGIRHSSLLRLIVAAFKAQH